MSGAVSDMDPARAPLGHVHGFDYLRAAMALAVIAWHMHVFDPTTRRQPPPELGDLINHHLLLLGVPVFFLVSLYLFIRKRRRGEARLGPRLEYIGVLYAFWMTVSALESGGMATVIRVLSYGWGEMLPFLISGGNSPFYYFFSLFLLTLLAFRVATSSRTTLWVLLGLSLTLLALLPLVASSDPQLRFLAHFTNPLNFLPYVFVAALAAGRDDAPGAALGAALLLAFAGLSVLEWLWLKPVFAPDPNALLPPYTRLSVAAGASLLFLAALRVQRPAPPPVRLLSELSLGLYCLHTSVILALHVGGFPMVTGAERALSFAVVVGASMLGTALLRRVLSHRLV